MYLPENEISSGTRGMIKELCVVAREGTVVFWRKLKKLWFSIIQCHRPAEILAGQRSVTENRMVKR